MKLVKYPNEFLTKKLDLFDFDKYDPLQISDKMISIMNENKGIGLSANQVGLNARIFVMKTNNIECNPTITVINPSILAKSDEEELNTEGCLSFDRKLLVEIKRPVNIQVKFLDKFAQTCIMSFTGIDARCFLHENDHLNGIVFLKREYIPSIKDMT